MTTFRVYCHDGSTFDVEAESPNEARKEAKRLLGILAGDIKKVKVVRDGT